MVQDPGEQSSRQRHGVGPSSRLAGKKGLSVKKLNAEMANGRLAMLGIAGAMFGEGQTGQTLAEQFDTLHFSIL